MAKIDRSRPATRGSVLRSFENRAQELVWVIGWLDGQGPECVKSPERFGVGDLVHLLPDGTIRAACAPTSQ